MHGSLGELQMDFFRKANLFMLFNMPTRKGTWNGHFKKIGMSIQHKNNKTEHGHTTVQKSEVFAVCTVLS